MIAGGCIYFENETIVTLFVELFFVKRVRFVGKLRFEPLQPCWLEGSRCLPRGRSFRKIAAGLFRLHQTSCAVYAHYSFVAHDVYTSF